MPRNKKTELVEQTPFSKFRRHEINTLYQLYFYILAISVWRQIKNNVPFTITPKSQVI